MTLPFRQRSRLKLCCCLQIMSRLWILVQGGKGPHIGLACCQGAEIHSLVCQGLECKRHLRDCHQSWAAAITTFGCLTAAIGCGQGSPTQPVWNLQTSTEPILHVGQKRIITSYHVAEAHTHLLTLPIEECIASIRPCMVAFSRPSWQR